MTQEQATGIASGETRDILFPLGIPGFGELREYRLYHSDTESGRVYWLTAVAEPEIVFALVDPQFYGLSYTLELTDEEQSLLGAARPEDIVILLMLRKEQDPDKEDKPSLLANIAGPILINVEQRIGMQKVLKHQHMALSITELSSTAS